MKVSVHLVTWNGKKYVPFLFDSLRKQTSKDWELVIWDNHSEDGMVAAMKEQLADFPVSHELIENDSNDGFAGGHNALFKKTKGKYILMLNQDMYLEPDCIENLLSYMDSHEDVAAVSPRLMRWDFAEVEKGEIENSFSEYVDALGLKVFRNRRVIEQYTQERWSSESLHADIVDLQKKEELDVFGVSGALPMFCREALGMVAFKNGNFLDQSYHSYKEDVDLAYRLRIAGLKATILLQTVAYHDRSAAGPKELSDSAASDNKKTQSSWVKYHSYKNHLMTLYKNEYWQNMLLDFVFIKWYETKKFWYFVLFDRKPLKGLKACWTLRKEMKEKRAQVKQMRNTTWKALRVWWT